MSKQEFFDIIQMDDLRVSIPKTSHFSLGASPYYAHQHGLAIDIYHNLTLEDYDALSPITGKIIKIKQLVAPKPKFNEGIDVDYLILISDRKNPDLVWKMMHVSPFLNVGEEVSIGDILGKTIRNGYFAYWSSPHLHLELRSSEDAIRARGGRNFSLAIESENVKASVFNEENIEEIPIEIKSIYPEIILVNLPRNFYHNFFPLFGLKARVKNLKCILDGGIPHYKIGTVINRQKNSFFKNDPVYFNGHKIGILHEFNGQLGFFKFDDLKFFLNDIEIRGISLYLANFNPQIKIIPYKKNQFSFKPKSIQYLKLCSAKK
jgi:hypothetical protein